MPITVTEGTRVLQAYGIQARQQAAPSRQSILGETALSQRGKEIKAAKRILETAPEVREDRVAAIKMRLAKGESLVSSDAVAEKMIYQGVADRLR